MKTTRFPLLQNLLASTAASNSNKRKDRVEHVFSTCYCVCVIGYAHLLGVSGQPGNMPSYAPGCNAHVAAVYWVDINLGAESWVQCTRLLPIVPQSCSRLLLSSSRLSHSDQRLVVVLHDTFRYVSHFVLPISLQLKSSHSRVSR